MTADELETHIDTAGQVLSEQKVRRVVVRRRLKDQPQTIQEARDALEADTLGRCGSGQLKSNLYCCTAEKVGVHETSQD